MLCICALVTTILAISEHRLRNAVYFSCLPLRPVLRDYLQSMRIRPTRHYISRFNHLDSLSSDYALAGRESQPVPLINCRVGPSSTPKNKRAEGSIDIPSSYDWPSRSFSTKIDAEGIGYDPVSLEAASPISAILDGLSAHQALQAHNATQNTTDGTNLRCFG
ncbi:hypothetical protein DFP72DRAFT_844816 [Ephemerocybe angulata]|uniref:Uncharacterized protein n=1 Tax=Ephemerocybe angulata TaxID=980116 RepID=A0A8H6I739_9AGAR|nr:hypothetical protein DFP72DRAFT_844816 [Tulosesus angulatus]